MIKTHTHQTTYTRQHPQPDRGHLPKNTTVNNIINDEQLKAFLIKLRMRQKYLLSLIVFNIILRFLPGKLGREKKRHLD